MTELSKCRAEAEPERFGVRAVTIDVAQVERDVRRGGVDVVEGVPEGPRADRRSAEADGGELGSDVVAVDHRAIASR